jgi:RHS repeat-associated protein
MTSDGTNSYSWDCENRLIKIVYPGSGNYSTFTYDGFGRNVEIVETVSGSVTSTKQFVWSFGDTPREARSSTGTVTAQYFALGETISGTNYFYTTDHLGLTDAMVKASRFSQLGLLSGHPGGFNPVAQAGSTREMTNSTGTVEAQYGYDSFGRTSVLQGSMAADFQYAGYYCHSPSGLGLAASRAYSSSVGRFINRDLIGEKGGVNLYAYVGNAPTELTDPSGTDGLDPNAPPCIHNFPDCIKWCEGASNGIQNPTQKAGFFIGCVIRCTRRFPPPPIQNPINRPGTWINPGPPGHAFAPPIVPIQIPGTPGWTWPGVQTPIGPLPLIPVLLGGALVAA